MQDGKIQYKHIYKVIIISIKDGVCQIEIKDENEAKLFKEKLEKCLEDVNLIDDSLIIGKLEVPTKKSKISNNETKVEFVKITKDDVLLSLYQPKATIVNKQAELEIKKEVKLDAVQNLKESLNEPSIVAKKFYSNERPKIVQISEEIEVFNEQEPKVLSTPKSNLKRRRDDENSHLVKSASKMNTPRRNMSNENSRQIRTTPSMNTRAMKRLNIDSENQENKIDQEYLKSPVKTWNRNNSRTFLKG